MYRTPTYSWKETNDPVEKEQWTEDMNRQSTEEADWMLRRANGHSSKR